MNKLLLIAALGTTLATVPSSEREQTSGPDVRIMDMKAVLYFEQDASLGSFDAMREDALWNTSVGEGAANGKPSNATLVLVRISGPHEEAWNATLHVVATVDWPTPGKRLADEHVSLKPFFGLPQVWIPIVLYGTGCTPVSVTATLEGAALSGGLKRRILFKCGE